MEFSRCNDQNTLCDRSQQVNLLLGEIQRVVRGVRVMRAVRAIEGEVATGVGEGLGHDGGDHDGREPQGHPVPHQEDVLRCRRQDLEQTTWY
ncbi:hypothetical protein J6590_003697 [Homalodisca vitripennis]|nr:hypothetical protein J6590_003697 [Homalodisca vitripennis]